MLAGPFGRQLAESGYAHAVWETTFDGRSYEVRREERERDSHVDLARAAALACCNCFDVCVGIDSEFVEPATPPRNRSDEKRAVFGTDRADLVSRRGLGHQDFPTPGRWRLAPWHLDPLDASLSVCSGTLCIGQFDDQPVWSDLNADDVIADENRVFDIGGLAEMIPDRFCDERLDLFCGHAVDASGLFHLALHEG